MPKLTISGTVLSLPLLLHSVCMENLAFLYLSMAYLGTTSARIIQSV